MNTPYKIILAGLISLFSFNAGFAQDVKMCGTYEMTKKLLDANPELRKEYLEGLKKDDEADKAAFANGYKEGDGKSMLTLYTIPVVFHILHLGGTENISDAQINDEIAILNNDYRKLNADISAVVPAFTSIAADCEIQFRLAQKDPNGNCTNGIDRIYTTETNIGDDGSKLNQWPRNQYLNIWVVKAISSGAAGYAYTPGSVAGGGSAANDGIVILSTYVGSIGTGNVTRSRALTHEIGHYLNLQHTWGPTNQPGCDGTATLTTDPCWSPGPFPAAGPIDNCSYDDGVTDTPNTRGWTSCNLTGNTCGALDNVQNYMDYSYCSNMYTTGQKTRMRSALTSTTASRNNLWTAANLTATGLSIPSVLCLADFQSSKTTNTVCQGDSLTFTDLSWNGNPTSWSWTFGGGTPATSTDSMPTIIYNTPGVYNVSMTVSNASGSVSAAKTGYITVYPNTASYAAPFYSEGFEGSAIPNVDWNVTNANSGTNTWTQTSTAAATGTKSVSIINASTYDGMLDELISPPINMTAITGSSPTLTFKVAHAQKTSTSSDKLQVYVSTNCAQTWVLRKTISGVSLSTAGVISTSFVPTASQWVTQSVNLTGYAGFSSLFVMFRFTSNAGNNIYLDDINIAGTLGIQDEISSNLNFNVYPNPAEDNTVIAFTLLENNKTDISICDVVGRRIAIVYSGELGAGEHQYTIADNAKLSAGVYFVKLTVAGESFTKKLIVN